MAMKALQEKIKVMENQRGDVQQTIKSKPNDEDFLLQQIQDLRN